MFCVQILMIHGTSLKFPLKQINLLTALSEILRPHFKLLQCTSHQSALRCRTPTWMCFVDRVQLLLETFHLLTDFAKLIRVLSPPRTMRVMSWFLKSLRIQLPIACRSGWVTIVWLLMQIHSRTFRDPICWGKIISQFIFKNILMILWFDYRMSKEDLTQICGLADGIRMFNILHAK